MKNYVRVSNPPTQFDSVSLTSQIDGPKMDKSILDPLVYFLYV